MGQFRKNIVFKEEYSFWADMFKFYEAAHQIAQ